VTPPLASNPATILVVDDDRRVVELLTIALNAYGYRVLQAGDGEEALRLASRERPDLVLLDVRLPKRSGYEVCEVLRQDPDDPELPIIMVSAASETEARLQGLARGADDYVAKPFSPKELIARIRRLLARSEQAREARRRSREAEHELGQAREEARRSHAELRDQLRLRELGESFTREFHACADVDSLSRRLLIEAQAHLGSGLTALLRSPEPDQDLRLMAMRAPAPERVAELRLHAHGELLALLKGLGRPVRRRDLDRFPELREELRPFVVAGIVVFAPLRDADGMVGVVVADERLDGVEVDAPRLEALGLLCDTAAIALRNARRAHLQSEVLLKWGLEYARLRVEGLSPEAAHQAALQAAGDHPSLAALRGVDPSTASRSR
jgi:DNA-binding response OmpR family regulator